MKAGSLNLLESSGPHRACYGTAFPFRLQVDGTGSGSSVVVRFCIEGFSLCFLLSLIGWLFRQLVISNVHTDLNDTECQNKIVLSKRPQSWFVYLKGKITLELDMRVYGEWRCSSPHSKPL